jgi:hypothetical protein
MKIAYSLALLIFGLLPSQIFAQQREIDNSQFVVFVHAGPKLSDPKIKQVTGALFAKGYLVRAPDNEQDKDGGAGVDYFDKAAEKTATEIAALVNERLTTLNLRGPDDVALVLRLQRVKNPPTYIGVWLFGKGK